MEAGGEVGVEIYRMDVGAAYAVMQIDGDGIPCLHAKERSRHPVIEGCAGLASRSGLILPAIAPALPINTGLPSPMSVRRVKITSGR